MNKLCLFFLILFLVPINYLFSQEINGVTTLNGSVLPSARVILNADGKRISYVFTDQNGEFHFPEIENDTVLLEVSHLKASTKILKLAKNSRSNLSIELESAVNQLPEIVIEKQVPIVQKVDTLVYKVSAFRDGTEKVVEDLLKKLPGITVAQNGTIFYKNKEISAMMLDGDDLFQTKYKIGSQNIDIEAVEDVEAIENFNNDKVIHQLTRTNAVALNLKLKKGIQSISANFDLQNDFFSRYDNTATGLVIGEKVKGFSTNSLTNMKRSDYMTFSFLDFSKTQLAAPIELIFKENFSVYPNGYVDIINNGFSTSNSAMFKLSKNLKSTVFVQYGFENLRQKINNQTFYELDNGNQLQYYNSDARYDPSNISLSNNVEFYNKKDLQILAHIQFDKHLSDNLNSADNNGILLKSETKSNTTTFGSRFAVSKKLIQLLLLSWILPTQTAVVFKILM